MFVLVSAVFDDHSRMELTAGNGLQISSRNEKAIRVEGQRVVVPENAEPFTGTLLDVVWNTSQRCSRPNGAISFDARQSVTLAVTPPQAKDLQMAASSTLLVAVDDPASKPGGDYPTSAQLTLELIFDSRTENGLESHSGTSFGASDGAPFTVSSEGKVVPIGGGLVGTGTVTASIAGRNVRATIHIEVAAFKSVEVYAVPSPAYLKLPALGKEAWEQSRQMPQLGAAALSGGEATKARPEGGDALGEVWVRVLKRTRGALLGAI